MKRKGFKSLLFGALYLIVFVVWTLLIQIVDVQPVGQNGIYQHKDGAGEQKTAGY